MNPLESKYWDSQAELSIREGNQPMRDNVPKRAEIVSRILKHRPYMINILEIGCGLGIAAASVNLSTLGMSKFTLTDVSKKYCDFVRERWRLETVHTDITKLPDGPFDMIWCFDSLEHVHPDDREAGFREMSRVLNKPGLILINSPSMDDFSGHDNKFDHYFDSEHLLQVNRVCGTNILKWEPYIIHEIKRSYTWLELIRE